MFYKNEHNPHPNLISEAEPLSKKSGFLVTEWSNGPLMDFYEDTDCVQLVGFKGSVNLNYKKQTKHNNNHVFHFFSLTPYEY